MNAKIETSTVPVYDDEGKEIGVEPADAAHKEMMKEFAGYYFQSYTDDGDPRPADVSELRGFLVSGSGIRIDLANMLPHVFGGMDASYELTWADLSGAGVLRTDTDLIARTKAARPQQPPEPDATN
ncbi:MAG: hypothetical protein KIT84_24480 [Labilithrix sp.]|nr:hypothetical protein [Labilithrix sp.]MCW5814206.1 hypothetical protein [Labilithrix sp.]